MKKRKSNVKKGLLIALCVFLGIVLTVLVAGTVLLNRLFGAIPRVDYHMPTLSPQQVEELAAETDPPEPEFSGEVLEPEDVQWQTEPAPSIGHEHEIINILLIGQDRRPGESRQRSDAMILCTINLDKKTLVMTSFLRDTYVQYPNGYPDHRLNSAYQWGGMTLLNDTLALNYGIHIDGNVAVDFESFPKVIDLMGGVDISLTEAEAARLNGGNGWYLQAGMQHLNGEQALAYSRIRKIGTDFARTNRQRTVLTSLLQSCKGSSLNTLLDILDSVLPMVTTDMTDQQIVSLAMDILPILQQLTITTQHIPADGTYRNARIKDMSVLVPDLEANRKLLQDTLLD